MLELKLSVDVLFVVEKARVIESEFIIGWLPANFIFVFVKPIETTQFRAVETINEAALLFRLRETGNVAQKKSLRKKRRSRLTFQNDDGEVALHEGKTIVLGNRQAWTRVLGSHRTTKGDLVDQTAMKWPAAHAKPRPRAEPPEPQLPVPRSRRCAHQGHASLAWLN